MIRSVLSSDQSVFLQMMSDFYHSSAVDHDIPRENLIRTFSEITSGSPYAKGYLIEQNGEPAGYFLLAFTYSNEVGGICCWVEEIFIQPQFQGHGLGTEVLTFLDETFGSSVKRFRLEMTPVNERAAALYARFGYQPLKYRQMVKDL